MRSDSFPRRGWRGKQVLADPFDHLTRGEIKKNARQHLLKRVLDTAR
jgi:hypothetical protein